jgi:hypothetical protein
MTASSSERMAMATSQSIHGQAGGAATYAVGDRVQFRGEHPWKTHYGIVTDVVDERSVRVEWGDMETSVVGVWSGRLSRQAPRVVPNYLKPYYLTFTVGGVLAPYAATPWAVMKRRDDAPGSEVIERYADHDEAKRAVGLLNEQALQDETLVNDLLSGAWARRRWAGVQ